MVGGHIINPRGGPPKDQGTGAVVDLSQFLYLVQKQQERIREQHEVFTKKVVYLQNLNSRLTAKLCETHKKFKAAIEQRQYFQSLAARRTNQLAIALEKEYESWCHKLQPDRTLRQSQTYEDWLNEYHPGVFNE